MKILPIFLATNYLLFFDIVIPERAEPFKFGAAGWAAAIGLALFLSAVAASVFLLFRRKLSVRRRLLVAAILLAAGIAGGAVIAFATVFYDSRAEQNQYHYR
jgi:hypothetical protein